MKESSLNNWDPRVRWVVDRVLTYHNLQDEALAINMLERHGGRPRIRLSRIFTGAEGLKVFYVYKSTYTKTFYKEVTVRKEVPRPKETSPHTSDREDNSEDSAEEEKKKKKETKKKKKLKKKPSKGDTATDDTGEGGEDDAKFIEGTIDAEAAQEGAAPPDSATEQVDSDTKEDAESKKTKKSKKGGKGKKRPKSPASVVETLPSEQAEQSEETPTMTIKMERIIRKEKKLPQLHIRFGPLPLNNVQKEFTYVYFLLRNSEQVPKFHTCQEAYCEMPKYFYVGTLKEPLLDVFLKQIKVFHLYCLSFLSDPFDDVCSQTSGLEKFLKHHRKEKVSCPSTEAYRSADSFGRRLTSLQRSLETEGDIAPCLKISYLRNPEERLEYVSKIVPFPSIVNMDPSDLAIEDRPDLIELVTKLKRAIPLDINTNLDSIACRALRPLKKQLLDSLKDLENLWQRSLKSGASTKKLDVSYLPELCRLTKEKVNSLTSNEPYIQHLEKSILTWAKYIESTLKKYQGTPPEGKGPLPLYEYWAVRHEQLSLFMEETQQPIIHNILVLMNSVNSPAVQEFKAAKRSLASYFCLCSDNVEYLKSTLTELKVLSRSNRLKEITRVVSDIVDGLRVMWVLSTYWGSEPNFVELLARIRWVICNKVTQILNVPKLFKMGNNVASVICQDAIDLMDVWKNSYSKTRSVIERTRCEQRWEFERDLLFQETEYISHVAKSLLDIINVIKNYEDLFCRQFINAVKDGSKIDSIVYRVKDLTMPLITADFNVFDREYAENWKILLECFWCDMKTVESEAIRVIRNSFSDLRSAVKAAELLNDLRIVITSEKLDRLLLSQFEAVSVQFSLEVKRVMDDFIENRENPPILRQHEVYSGSVYWSRSLYSTIRDVLLTLQDLPDVLKTRKYHEALDDYSSFVDMISFYEKSIFIQMLHKYMPVVSLVFEKSIIKIVRKTELREQDDFEEYWEWISKKKKIKRPTAIEIAYKGKVTIPKRKKPTKKLVRRTIEEALRGVSASSSMSDSSCSSALSSDASSADESDVLSLMSQIGSLDESLSGTMHEEAEEIQVASIAHSPQLGRKSRKLLKPKGFSEPRRSVVDMNGFPLGDGVYKPLAEILKDPASRLEPKPNDLSQRRHLSSYNETYRLTSSGSSTPVTEDTDGSGSEADAPRESVQKANLSSDLLSASWQSSSPSERSNTSKDDLGTSRKKYSKSHLKSLINLVRTRHVDIPPKPRRFPTSQYRLALPSPSFKSGGEHSILSRTLEASAGEVRNKRRKTPVVSDQVIGTTSRAGTHSGVDSDSTPSDDKSCDTDSSYSAQQLRRKALLKSFSSRVSDAREASFAQDDVEEPESTSSESEITDTDTNEANKIESFNKLASPEGEVVGEVRPDESPEVAVVVARDIYNGVPRKVPGLIPKFVDGLLPPSQLSHPSTFSTRFVEKTTSSGKSIRKRRKKRTWRRRTKPLTFWQAGDSDSHSSDTSFSSSPTPHQSANRLHLFKKYQDAYRARKFHRFQLVKLPEIEDWSDGGKKFKSQSKKTLLNTVRCLRGFPTARFQVPAAPTLASEAKIYCGCRHDVKRFSWNEFMGADILIEHGYSIQVNYSETYECALHEMELFEELGYEIPEDLKHISVIKNTLHSDIQCVVKVVRRYQSVLENLNPTQIAALKLHISSIEKMLYFGLTQYTWSSLNIPEFCSSVMSELTNLDYLALQLRHMESCIEAIVLRIVEVDSFQCPTSDVYNFQLFFKYCDFRRDEALKTFTRLYRQISLVLYKMECLLFSKMTGCSEHLLLYYVWTENTLFNGLVSHVTRNLTKYEDFLLGTSKNQFSVDACFEDNIILLKPELALISHQLASQAENIVGMLYGLVRWQEGTCHFAPQLKSSSSGSIHRFSFVEDLIQCSEVKSALDHIYETVSLVTEEIDKYMERWTKYRHLWIFDKDRTMLRFVSEEPSLAEYDECFSCYQTTIEELKNRKPTANVYCVRVKVKSISQKILNFGLQWKSIMGDQLLASSLDHAAVMKTKTMELYVQLSQSIVSLETFQSVLQAVNDSASYQVEAELGLKEIHERHHLLKMWKVTIPDEHEKTALEVEDLWYQVRRFAAYRTHLLAPTMKLFVTKATEVCDLFAKTSLVFGKTYFSEGPGTLVHDLNKGLDKLQEYISEFDEMESKRQKMVQAEKLFDLQPMNFDVFCSAHQTLKFEILVFDIYRRQREEKETWSSLLWNNFNPNKLLAGIDSYLNEFAELPEKCQNMPIAIAVKKHMEDFKRSIPLMVDLQNVALRERHWDELMSKTKYKFSMDLLHTKMKHLFSMKLYEHYSLVAEIIANAEKEAIIEAKLCSISVLWSDEELPIVQHYKSNGEGEVYYTLGPIDDIIMLMENSITELMAMNQSRFAASFIVPIRDWSFNLSEALDVLRLWKDVQSDWSNLEYLYRCNPDEEDLRNGLELFKSVDSSYLEITRRSKNRPNVFSQCLQHDKKTDLVRISGELEVCCNKLRNFVDKRRDVCSRFHFLKDDEILQLLGSTKLPSQNILSKMFKGVEFLQTKELSESDGASNCNSVEEVTGMVSVEGEILPFVNQVISSGQRMDTLIQCVLNEMRVSMMALTSSAIHDQPSSRHNRKEWSDHHLGCTILTSNQVWFCSTVENAFIELSEGNQKSMRKLLVRLNRELEEDMRVIRSDLKNNDRKKLTTLLVQDAHSREVIERFVAFNVMNADEFEWTSQLRFYWVSETSALKIRQCEGNFDYGFEYMGLAVRQVITPLTERARLTITQALTMKQGTSVVGPTATGKKETIRDLAVALGTLCVVVNCGISLDNKDFAGLLRTMGSCGVWTCFDKFDRLSTSTLSLISTSLFALRQALLANMDNFYCEGILHRLVPTTNVFISISPANSGGHPLPESIKTLFRPVVCMCPDTEQICIITLISEGFIEAKVLAKKMTCLYKLAKTLLTQAHHYDFGLRVIKSVLCVAGALKRNNPSIPERYVLMRALRDVFMPKLLKDDVPFFIGLLKDVFPTKETLDDGNPDLEAKICECMDEVGLIKTSNQVTKVIQLSTMCNMWNSVIVVGPTSSGKSVIVDTFMRAQTKLGQPIKTSVLNPNICTLAELYGHYLPNSEEWADGIVPSLVKTANSCTETAFIIFDGTMHSDWVENISSVMDDNRTLTLTNGDRIRLGNHCRLLFETGLLSACSPATVSRTGIVYVDPNDLGYDPYWNRWIKSRMDVSEAEILQQLYKQFVPSCFGMILQGHLQTEVPCTTVNMITQLCLVIDAQLPIIEPAYRSDVEDPLKPPITRQRELTCVFVQAFYLSVGAVLTDESKIPFDQKIKELSGMPGILEEAGSSVPCGNFPKRLQSLFDYKYDIRNKQWMPWSASVDHYHHDSSQKTFDMLVPNEELSKTLWSLDLLCKHNAEDIEYQKFDYREKIRPKVKRPILMIGPSGSAKTSIILQYLKSLRPETYERLVVNLPPRAWSAQLQNLIEQQLTRTMSNILQPKDNKKLLVFIDDLDMVMHEEPGPNQTYEFLKFFLERHSMYSRGKVKRVHQINHVHFIGALGKQAAEVKHIDPRFLSLFVTYKMSTGTMDTIRKIYRAILAGHTEGFSDQIRNMVEPLLDTTITLFNVARKKFLPSPHRFQYIYNVRDLANIFSSLLSTRKELFTDKCHFLRAWRNEFTRVICDRLMTEEDQQIMKGYISEHVGAAFPECSRYVMRNPLLFGDFRNAMIKTEPRKYEDLLDYEAVYHLFTEILVSYNKEAGDMRLILFEDALEHLTRIHRALRQTRGHILLLGAPNSGKRSLTKLASYAAVCLVSMVTLRRYHDYAFFWNTLSKLIEEIGLADQPTTFLLTSEHPIPEEYLELLNDIISHRCISSVLTDEQRESILEQIMMNLRKDKIIDKNKAFEYFTERCLNNLHVVMCVAPVHHEFKKCCSLYPGIIRNSYVNWMFPWPKAAIQAIASTLLKDEDILPETAKQSIIESSVHVHHSAVQYVDEYRKAKGICCYLSPNHFLNFIQDYLSLTRSSLNRFFEQSSELRRGLKKLDESSATLQMLNQTLAQRKELIDNKVTEIEGLSTKIAEAEETLSSRSDESKESSLQATALKKMMYKQDAEIEELMNKANPQLYLGRSVLSELDQDSISSMCASAAVPEPVQVVCECVALLRGAQKLDWPAVKEYVEDPFIQTKLRELDPTTILDETIQKIRTRIRSSRRIGEMEQISAAGFCLMKYVDAISNFCTIYKDVRPLQKRAKDLEKNWHKLTSDCDALNEEISVLQRELELMKSSLSRATSEQMKMIEQTSQMDMELQASNSLFEGLLEDRSRWKRRLDKLEHERDCVFGDTLLNAAFLNYVSIFDPNFRRKMIYTDWKCTMAAKSIQITPNYTLETQLIDDLSISRCLAEGLPRDIHSIQNVILLKRSSKYPLLVDPDQQMLAWILAHEAANDIRRLSTCDKNFARDLVASLTLGRPILLSEFEYLNCALESVVHRSCYDLRDGVSFVSIDQECVPVNVSFRMYIVITSFYKTLDPSLFACANVVDCTLTDQAIEDKCTGIAMGIYHEPAEMERDQMFRLRCDLLDDLQNLQNDVLKRVSSYDENIFDDFPYIQSLTDLKNQAALVCNGLTEQASKIDELSVVRETYADLARRSTLLFRGLNAMKVVSSLANSSFDTFACALNVVLAQLVGLPEDILERLTWMLYDHQCKGLKNKDKLLYSFLLATKMEIMQKRLSEKQLKYFLKSDCRPLGNGNENLTKWMNDEQWEGVKDLQLLFPAPFESLADDMQANGNEWKQWLKESKFEGLQLPGKYEECFGSRFEKLLLLKILKVDCLHSAIMQFIERVLGASYLTPSTVKMKQLLPFCTPHTPVLIHVCPGTDQLNELLSISTSQDGASSCTHVAIGEGSEEMVVEKLKESADLGKWLIVQNCHLLPSFMFRLFKEFNDLESKHADFRLWITTEDPSNFQLQFVLKSHKVVIESVSPLKLNLLDTFHFLDLHQRPSCVHPAFGSTVFALAFFHGVIEERKKFGKYGWNMVYEFTKTDLLVSITIIKQYLNKIFYKKNCKIPWGSLRYFIGEVVYGGRVIDNYDRRIVMTYINEYFGDFILESSKPFKFNRAGEACQYPMPLVGEKQEYISYLNSLPLMTEPSVFGVHRNRQRDVEIELAKDLCLRLSHSADGIEESDEASSLNLQPDDVLLVVEEISAKIPDEFHFDNIRSSLGPNPKPTTLYILRELVTFNQLIHSMKSALDEVKKAVNGLSVMTTAIDDVRKSLLNYSPPRVWSNFAPESNQNIASWLSHFEKRHDQFSKWVSRGEPWIVWLSGLTFPKAYLTAVSQVACRDEGWQIDTVALHTDVTNYHKPSEIPAKPKTGFYAEGLLLDGASWDKDGQCLASSSDSANLELLPIVGLYPMPVRGLPIQGCIRLPLYGTTRRGSKKEDAAITELSVPTRKHESYWILENVCIVLSD